MIWFYSTNGPSTDGCLRICMHGTGLTWLMNLRSRTRTGACHDLHRRRDRARPRLAGWLLISGTVVPHYPLASGAWFCMAVSLCTLGCVVMLAADVQKYTTLQLRRGLITTGMFKWVRHPNYLGEILVYGSLAMLAWHWLAALVLAYFWITMFATNMAMKEASMSRYPEWAAYRKRTWWLVPGIF
jgi:protein-S-isoprenylcysteine O-methyltransferase Ste14